MNEEKVDISNLSHPASVNEPPAYGKTMPSGKRAVGSFDTAYDGKTPVYEDLSLLRDFRPLKPGQKYGHRGSTVFNPKPEDPEQEAIYGKREYKEKISKEDPRAVLEKMRKQENEISELRTQLDTVIKILSQKEPTENNLDEIMPVDYDNMSYWQLVKLAKSKGMEGLKGISKEDVIAKLKE